MHRSGVCLGSLCPDGVGQPGLDGEGESELWPGIVDRSVRELQHIVCCLVVASSCPSYGVLGLHAVAFVHENEVACDLGSA